MPPQLDNAALLRRLVSFDSVSRNSNLPIADFIADYLDRRGIRISRQASPDGTKTNLIVEAGPPVDPTTRAGLTLSGHMDVVPAEEPEWRSDPFEVVERDGRFVGRGTADMKGFIALAMNRLASLDPARLKRPLALLLSYDEELGTIGARHFAQSWPGARSLPRDTIIGEPTSLKAVRMHKGHCKLRLTIFGITAHSGYPHLGHSAIEPAARAITAVARLRETLAKERPAAAPNFPEVPYVTLNVGLLHGGVAVNVVPDRCEAEIGLRVLPGMESETLIARVQAAVSSVLEGERWTLEPTGDSPPFILAEERPIYRMVTGLVHQTESSSVAFATDAGWLQTVGFDCVIWGPGDIEVAHKPNEALSVEEFTRGARLLERLVQGATMGEAG